jgi:hypothetical protein
MGLFGKKKATTPVAQESTGRRYVAPDLEAERGKQSTSPLNVNEDGGASQQNIEQQNTAASPIVAAGTVTHPPFETSGYAENAPPSVHRVGKHILLNQPSDAEDQSMLSGENTVLSGGTQTLQTIRSTDSQESKDTAFTITRNGQYLTLNGFANGHLMRWKFAAEEGSAIIRIPAILCAIAVIVSTLTPIVTIPDYWNITVLISAFHTCFACFFIIILEVRVLGIRNPENHRARIRMLITRYVALLKLLWGRGLLYIYAGSMNLTVDYEYVLYTGITMIVLGLLALGAGLHASMNLDHLKSSLTDESYLWDKFKRCDSKQDGYLDMDGFAELLWSLGLEFDDMYTHRAFHQIDRDSDKKVSFDDFRHWWIVTQTDAKRSTAGQN